MKTTFLLIATAAFTLLGQSVPDGGPSGIFRSGGGFTGQVPTSPTVSRAGTTILIPEDTGIHIYGVVEDEGSEEASVHFALQESSFATLGLTCMDGEPIVLIAGGFFEPGNHRETFSTEDLAPGMYIIRLDALGGSAYTIIYLLR